MNSTTLKEIDRNGFQTIIALDRSAFPISLWIGVIFLLFVAVGCNANKAITPLSKDAAKQLGTQLGEGFNAAKAEAQKVAEKCFDFLKSQKMDDYFSCYGEEFYQVTSKEEWGKYLAVFDEKLGTLESYELVNWQARVQLESADSKNTTTMVVLFYKTTHAKYKADETLTMMKKTDEKEFKIVGHNVESKELLLQ